MTISNISLGVVHAEKRIKPLLAERNDQVRITLEDVSDEYVDVLFGSLMQSAMASGGRRLAVGLGVTVASGRPASSTGSQTLPTHP